MKSHNLRLINSLFHVLEDDIVGKITIYLVYLHRLWKKKLQILCYIISLCGHIGLTYGSKPLTQGTCIYGSMGIIIMHLFVFGYMEKVFKDFINFTMEPYWSQPKAWATDWMAIDFKILVDICIKILNMYLFFLKY